MQNYIRLFVLVFAALSICSCKQESNSFNPNSEINIRISKDPQKLNPLTYPSSASREIYQYILLPLGDFDPETLELIPILIKDIPTPRIIEQGDFKGNVAYDMEFLEEATWADGSAITAEDFIFTMKAVRADQIESSAWRSFFKDLKSIEVDDSNPQKFTVIFSKPYMLALEAIITANLFPKYVYDPTNATDKIDLSGKPLDTAAPLDSTFINNFNGIKHSREVVSGAGPYKLVEWEADQFVVLERIENHWGKKSKNPYLKANAKTLVFKIIPDELTAMAMMKSDKIDIYSGISSANFEAAKKNGEDKLSFFTPQLIRYYYLMLNNADPILSDSKVRRALAYCTPVDQMIENFENGLAQRQRSLFHATKSYADQSLKSLSYDLDKAKELLSQAGWEDSDNNGVLDKTMNGEFTELKLEIIQSSSELGKKVALMLKEEARKVGVLIDVNISTNAEIRKAVSSGEYQIYPGSVVQDANDDDPYNRWHSEGPRNYMNYKNPLLDKLIEENKITLDRESRKRRYEQMQKLVYEDQPVIFLYSPKERIIVSSDLRGSVSSRRPGYLANTFQEINVFSEN